MDDGEHTLSMFDPGNPLVPIPGAVEVFAAWSLDQLADCHASLRKLHQYWTSQRGDRAMPARGDLDPVDLKTLLPLLILIDVVPDPRRYVYRLVGTREVEMRGGDPTGKPVEEAYYGESAEDTTYYLDRVVRTRQPVLYRGTYQPLSTRTQREDVLFLPLSKDGEAVNMILVLGHTDWVKEESRA
ncbi:MAG TPA: PAS domain-containing protein [Dongiaceae bacterium]|jgi:hypothetical protein|nr:PAS domain-containing protein [Dongiaceae bacterium]